MEQVLFNPDLIAFIFSCTNIPTASDYKAIIATCRIWYKTLKSPKREHALMDVLSTFAMRHKDQIALFLDSENVLNLDVLEIMINTFPNELNYGWVSQNRYLTKDFIMRHQHTFAFNWNYISDSIILDIDLLNTFKNKWSAIHLATNPTFTTPMATLMIEYELFPERALKQFASNPNITVEFIKLQSESYVQDIIGYLLENAALFDYMIEHYPPQNAIEFHTISLNYNITPEYIRKNEDKLNWSALSQSRALTIPLIREFAHKIDENTIVYNPNLTSELIVEYNITSHYGTSFNKNLTLDFITKYTNILHWNYLSFNRALTLPIINQHIDKIPWMHIIHNPNVTIAFLEEHADDIINALSKLNL